MNGAWFATTYYIVAPGSSEKSTNNFGRGCAIKSILHMSECYLGIEEYGDAVTVLVALAPLQNAFKSSSLSVPHAMGVQ